MHTYWQELDQLGEDKVLANRTAGLYAGKRLKYVNAWLERNAQLRAAAEDDRNATSNAEQLSIARSAKDAAWAAADAAREAADVARDAARNAKNANTIAIGALIVATIGAAPTIYAFSGFSAKSQLLRQLGMEDKV